MEPHVTGAEETPAEVLAELDEHQELVLAVHERDFHGLPGAARRILDRALGIEPPSIFPPPTEGPT